MTASPETPSPSTTPAPPRYRYSTVAPATVRLPVEDITALLPAGAWIGSDADKRRDLALPASEILAGNFPRIRFARLRDLLPGCIQPVADAPEWIVLPTDRVALAYQPETRREVLAESLLPTPPNLESAPPALPDPVLPDAPHLPMPAVAADKPVPAWKRLLKPILAPPPAPPAVPGDAGRPDSPPPSAIETSPPAPEIAPPLPAPVTPPPLPTPVALRAMPLAPAAERRLQQAFMTEETLSISQLLDLASALPGLRGCVLVRGAEWVTGSGTPAGLDFPALAAAAGRLLDQLDAIGTTSGLHFRPAVTLYAESGPLSFLRHGDLGLLVVHRERGFLPGVREKLETLLDALVAA